MSEPLLCAFLTSSRGDLIRQLLRSTGEAVSVVAVLRDRPTAIDDPGVPTGLRSGSTHELLAERNIPLIDCYLPKRGGDKAARALKQEENVLLALGDAGVQLLCLIEYERPLLPSGPLLRRYAPGRLLHITPSALSLVSQGEDGTSVLKPHVPLGPDDTLETLLRSFETPGAAEAATPPRRTAARRWLATARAQGFSSEGAMWQELYVQQERALKELSVLLDAAIITIRTRLLLSGIPIRSRGGANRSTEPLSDSELDTILSEGIASASRRLGITYPALYWRVCTARRLRRERARAEAKK